MALSHLLDSSVYSQPLKPRPIQTVEERWESIGDSHLAISALCDAEVLYGLELKGSAILRRRYEEILKGRLHVFPVDDWVAVCFAQIKAAARKKGAPCPDIDLLIAATAKAHGLIVATLNPKHFLALEGVAVEDWSK